jgi:hypothetical protein
MSATGQIRGRNRRAPWSGLASTADVAAVSAWFGTRPEAGASVSRISQTAGLFQSVFSTFQNTGVAGPSITPLISLRQTEGMVHCPSGM